MRIIETKNLTKKFGEFTANREINFVVKSGEIHALIGENGAGKSTLMNMFYGLVKPTSGEIYFKGQKVNISSPKKAMELGIGMVHQHFKLVPSLTVAENILLGTEKIILNKRNIFKKVEELIKKYDFRLDPSAPVENLSVGKQQQVEILKMLYRDVDLLILDEPTAVLGPKDIDELIKKLFELKEKGKTIIIITHKLKEVMKTSDYVTIIRSGKIIDSLSTCQTNEDELARLMVGRDIKMDFKKIETSDTDRRIICEIKDLELIDNRGIKIIDRLNLNVREGEILGIAGVEGNGQTELGYILSGLLKPNKGKILFKGNNITNTSPRRLRELGIGIIPEDRYRHGLCQEMSVYENIIAGKHHFRPYSKYNILNKKYILENTISLVEKYNIKVSDINESVSNLSGGNAQKIIIARELSDEKDMIIANQPTRGVDIASIELIHKMLIQLRNNNKAIILISAELSEILNLSDRIIVLYRGKVQGELKAKEATRENIGYLMAGMGGVDDAKDARNIIANF